MVRLNKLSKALATGKRSKQRGILGIFGGGSQATPAAPAPATPANATTPAPGTQTAAPAAPPTLDDQLKGFASLIQAPQNKALEDAKNNQGQTPSGSPFASITDESLGKAVAGARISASIKPDVLNSLFDGNAEKSAAFAGILDQVFQAGLVMSARNSIKMSEVGMEHLTGNFTNTLLPNFMQEFKTREGVAAAHPLLANPAFKPMYDSIVAGLKAQYPTASVQDITAEAKKQFDVLAAAMAPAKPTQQTQQQNSNVTGVFDDAFFKMPSASPVH